MKMQKEQEGFKSRFELEDERISKLNTSREIM